eukprot:9467868-Pyramimonas_sp.AAC.1
MGHPFVKKHSQSDMTIFAIVEESWKETFEQSWSELVQSVSSHAAVGDLPTGTPEEPKGPQTDQKHPRLPKDPKGPKDAIKNPPKEPPIDDADTKQKKKEIEKLFKEAGKVKHDFVSVTHTAIDILSQINDETADWKFARGDKQDMLKEKIDDLKASLSPVGREFVLEKDQKKFKANHTTARLVVEMQSFKDLQSKVAELQSIVERLGEAKKALKF